MPRLSVDLDLVFPDHGLPRDRALARIGEALQQSAERLKARGFQTRVQAAADASETKLLVRRGPIEVKIEVNFVMEVLFSDQRDIAQEYERTYLPGHDDGAGRVERSAGDA